MAEGESWYAVEFIFMVLFMGGVIILLGYLAPTDQPCVYLRNCSLQRVLPGEPEAETREEKTVERA